MYIGLKIWQKLLIFLQNKSGEYLEDREKIPIFVSQLEIKLLTIKQNKYYEKCKSNLFIHRV